MGGGGVRRHGARAPQWADENLDHPAICHGILEKCDVEPSGLQCAGVAPRAAACEPFEQGEDPSAMLASSAGCVLGI